MAKLVIFRGETPHDQVELTEQTVRIGRNPQNEVVLDDQGRGVSRTHAEIRFEGGRYVLYDHESQNGVWVAGMRVPSVALEPGVVATIGPFRLSVEAAVPSAAAGALTDTAATEFTQLSEHAAVPLALDDLVPPAPPAPPPSPAASQRAQKLPAASPAASQRAQTPPPPAPKGPQWYAQPRVWLVSGASIVVIALVGTVAYWLLRTPPAPPFDVARAQMLVDNGQCPEAMEKLIAPALDANPGNAEARALRDRCAAPPTPPQPPAETSTVPPTPTIAERLDQAEALMAANDCPTALNTIGAVLAEDPANERAKAMSAKAQACAVPQPVPPVAQNPPVRKPFSEPGLDRKQGESDADYRARALAMRTRYDETVALVQERRFGQAQIMFDRLLADGATTAYLELEKWRTDARNGARTDGKRALDNAHAAENRGDLVAAGDWYRRARNFDSSLDTDAAIQRVEQKKIQVAEQHCANGEAAWALSRNAEAIAAYQEAVKLLSPSHGCYAIAQERLKKMGK